MKKMILVLAAVCLSNIAVFAQQGASRSGELTILTTPEGANLPAGVVVENFPLLVRLNKDWFDFAQAQKGGADLRFTDAKGAPLAYDIETWDADKGEAIIWVRVPKIEGNARQTLRLSWGKADAQSESNAKAVFNEANGYASVWHMGETVADETGATDTKNQGTTPTAGIIGTARHFAGKQGIFGDHIATYPVDSAPSSTEVWMRAEAPNSSIIGWGDQIHQGKIVMQFRSPPHIGVDAWFSEAGVEGSARVPLGQWNHVVHTFRKGEAIIYVNGVMDAINTKDGAPLKIPNPARLWIGGWTGNYDFTGDLDEVRISKVARSADWVRLEYENQKPLQTLVGPLVQKGDDFSVSQTQLKVAEGQSATLTAKAGGAQKVYWILKKDGKETIVAVDKFSFTFSAGRVAADTPYTLQFKAVRANETKTQDIAVTVSDAIPDPVVMLKAPATWNGRDTIFVEPVIKNLAALKAKNVADIKTVWSVSGGAVIKEIAPDKLILKRSQYSGKITVQATLDNGGAPVTQAVTIAVTEPKSDPWLARTADKDEKPLDGQFYARDDKNEGTLFYNGTLTDAADAVFLKLYADDTLIKTETAKPAADKSYALTTKLKPGLIKYKVEFGTKTGGVETVVQTVGNIVCGDAYIIEGQSNALATDTGEKSPPETSEWIRSYGRPQGTNKDGQGNLWCNPVWKARNGEKAELGWWGMELAKRLVASQKMPIFIINAAVGGTRIDQHQRNEADPTDLSTIYGRMLWRVQQARLTHGIRGILWHQGENNQGSAAPTGDYDWKSYQDYFLEISAGWKRDFPNVQHYYVFQIWPNSCAMAGNSGAGDMIREIQRSLPRLYSHMSVMSTLGIKPPGGCHFPLVGWSEFARLIHPLIERDNYGKVPNASITPPNLLRAYFTGPARDAIALEFDQPIVWTDAPTNQIYLDGEKGKVASGVLNGNVLMLKLKGASTATKITYLKESDWSQDTLIFGANGIAALTFCDVPIVAAKPAP